ncbi:DUF2141 domain-containing protein [Roseateles sp. GG27B]
MATFTPTFKRAHRLLALLTLAGVAASTVLVTPALAADMELEVTGILQTDGQLLVAVFADEADWLRKPVLMLKLDAAAQQGGRLIVALTGLPAGRLALNVTHDLNGNGRLDMNAIGIPAEPYGFSNNASGNFGPPRFEQAVFEVKDGGRLTLQLN